MKRYDLFLILVLSLIIISGCSTSYGGQSTKGPLTGSPNGINIEFLEGKPPAQLLEGIDSFEVVLKLTNNAACDVSGKIHINDYAPDSLGGITKLPPQDFNIPGALTSSTLLPYDEFRWAVQPYSGLQRDSLGVTVEATAIYNCEVKAGPQICLKKGDTKKIDTTCPDQETITGTNLKATVSPVTITKIEKRFNPTSGSLTAVITFSKNSEGIVSNQESVENPLTISQENPVNVNVDFAGNQMNCFGTNFNNGILNWKATDDDKEITCTGIVNFVDNRVDDYLNIDIALTYKITESKSIKITKLTQIA